ncbi:MAG: carboxyl transferase domain-containing protein [Myxococcota bacterium]
MQRLFIANRGEIAVRIARAATELDITPVLAFEGSDEAPSAFLDAERLRADARRQRCDAVHPGYGFLSESATFAKQVADDGLIFVGPSPDCLALLADKAAARGLAKRCGVTIVAGTDGPTSCSDAEAFVRALPVGGRAVLNAIAGGGGRGMRIVDTADDVAQQFELCRREAEAAFGDGNLFVERYVSGARHIEVQVVGDGVAVRHLGERDCTLQRRHQKLIEVAPAPSLDEALRTRVTEAAVRLAQEVGYRNVGTFEFLVVGDEAMFIEANPRLQVEHTVTEAVWGVDIVHLQLRLAAGASLSALDVPSTPRGCAIQLRVNVRAASAGSADGPVRSLRWPGGPGVRIDSAIVAGAAPDLRFDALLGKISVWSGAGFEGALRRARRALAETELDGLGTSLPLLRRLCGDPAVGEWTVDTGFIDRRAVTDDDPAAIDDDGGATVVAPLSGTVVEAMVAAGDSVAAGQPCVVLEALKLHTVVPSPRAGTVLEVGVRPGQLVAHGQALLRLGAADDDAGVAPFVPSAPTSPRPELAELRQRLAATRDDARPDKVARRHARRGRTARENVADLCDPDSFIEYGALAIAAQRQRHDEAQLRATTPADGIVTGMATINAARFGDSSTRCMVMIYDYTVLAGTQGMTGHKKMDRMFDVAAQARVPVVLFAEGGGGRPGDTDIAGASFLDNHTFTKLAALRGRVPVVGVVHGRCFAGNAALLACADIVIATESTSLGMAGPAMIEGAGLGTVAADDVGPVRMHAAQGGVDIVVPDEAAAVATAQRVLSFVQGTDDRARAPEANALADVLPRDRLHAYDVGPVIDGLFDLDSSLEVGAAHGRAVRTFLARIDGSAVAVIASNCRHLAGAIDTAAARKAAAFMRLAGRLKLPIVVLCDTPGFMVGPEAEAEGLVSAAGDLFVAGAQLAVPIVGLVMRKAYGLGAQALLGGGLHRPGLTVAWPTGELGAMGPQGAVRLAYRRQLAAIADPEAREAEFARYLDAMNDRGRAVNAATFFEVDAVIDPVESRAWLARALPQPSGSPWA